MAEISLIENLKAAFSAKSISRPSLKTCWETNYGSFLSTLLIALFLGGPYRYSRMSSSFEPAQTLSVSTLMSFEAPRDLGYSLELSLDLEFFVRHPKLMTWSFSAESCSSPPVSMLFVFSCFSMLLMT